MTSLLSMKTFTEITGSTASNSNVKYGGSITTLANNNSPAAVSVAQALVNDQHRYLIQRYFDNERSFAVPTLGAQNLTLTTTLNMGASSAVLNSAWTYATCQQFVNFSSGDQRMTRFTNGSTALSWDVGLSKTATASISTVGLRDYPIPANVSKIKNDTVTVGQLVFQPFPTQSRQEWDMINTLPYTSDIPNYFFIWNGTIGIWPIPSTTNNVLTFNYKSRVPDLTFQDYSTGNITGMTPGSYNVTGATTAWSSTGGFPLNTDISWMNLMLRVDPPYGDGTWYPIQRFNSDTSLTLLLPVVNAPNITAASTYTIGQVPVLQEDFHDMLIYGALMTYYNSIVKDPDRYKLYEDMYNRRMTLLEDYAGTKSVTVDLEQEPPMLNPNLMIYQNKP